MMFQVMTIGRAEVMIRHGQPKEVQTTKIIIVPPMTILDVYGYIRAEDTTRFIVWNEKLSTTFFTVSINDCKPVS